MPQITKHDLDKQIADLKASTPKTCEQHGGIDCAAGPDTDGSVLCFDGFREAAIPFDIDCLQAKLQVAPITVSDGGDFEKPFARLKESDIRDLSPYELRISLRNITAIKAQNISVHVAVFDAGTITLNGPAEIEPYDVGEYRLTLSDIGPKLSHYRLMRSTFTVECENCRIPSETRSLLRP